MANKGNVGTLAFGVKVDLKKFQKSMKKMKKSLDKFGKAAGEVGKMFAGLGVAAAAGLAASAKAFADYGDEIAKTSRKTGIAVDELTKLQFAAERSGASLPQLVNGLRKMQVNLVQAAKGGGVAKRELEDIGINAEKLLEKTPSEQFREIAKSIAEIENPTKQGAAAMALFGKQGAELLPLFQEGPKGLEALMAEAERLGVTMNSLDATNAEKLTDAFSDLGTQVKQVFIKIGAQMAQSGLISTVQLIIDRMPLVFEWITKVGGEFRVWAQAVLPDLIASFWAIWDSAKIVFDNISMALGSFSENGLNSAEDTFLNFANMFKGISKLMATFGQRITLAFIGIGDFIGNALLLPFTLVENALFHLFNQLAKLPGKVGKIAGEARDQFSTFTELGEEGLATRMLGGKGVTDALEDDIVAIENAIDNTFDKRKTQIKEFVGKSLEDVTKASKALEGAKPKKSGGLFSFIGDVTSAVEKGVKAASDFAKDNADKIAEAFATAPKQVEIAASSPAAIAGSIEAFRIQNISKEDKTQKDQLKVQKETLKVLKEQQKSRGI